MKPVVLICDDHSMIRRCIRDLCELRLKIASVSEATNCHQLMRELSKRIYTHLVLDINLADGSTLEVLPTIRNLYPSLRVVILSMQSTYVYERSLKKLGVIGFISKSAPEEETIDLLRAFFSNSWDVPVQADETKEPFSDLSSRELEILHHLLKGIKINQIGELLNLKQNTISTLKARIFKKTATTSVVELKELATLHGIA